MIDENIGGNEQALHEEAVVSVDSNVESQTSSDNVNPSAIRKSQTQGILNALSKASGQSLTSVEDAVAFIAKSTAQSQLGGNAQPVVQRQPELTQTRSVSNNDLQEQFQNLQKQKLLQAVIVFRN